MSAEGAQSYFQHPLYPLAMYHFQQGEWRAGLTAVERLVQLFPLDQELRSLRQEFNFRARLDQFEIGDRAVEARRRLRRLIVRVGAASVILVGAILAARTYSSWVGQQVTAARQRVEREIQAATLSAKQRDVEALMHAERLTEAASVLDEMIRLDPSFPSLEGLRLELTGAMALADQYDQAMRLIEIDDWLGAQSVLQQIAAVQPNYRDISLQMSYIERQTLLGNLLTEAESRFYEGAWQEAVLGFETIRTLHPQEQPEYVEARLFESYVNAARSLLIGQADSLEALQVAETYFRKALVLRPQDPEIKHERELAGLYLNSQDDFDQGQWSEVITGLEIVIGADPSYAQGTARQTLYDAYVARGDAEMSLHLYDGALSDYDRAVTLAEQDPEAVLRLYEAQLKVGEAQGAKGSFEAAVLHYRAAAELGNLRERGAQDNPALLSVLQDAERYAANGNFSVAYERYRQAIRLATASQVKVIHVVQQGEYLTLLASRYGSTVRAIALANGIENYNLIFFGQQLLIPVMP